MSTLLQVHHHNKVAIALQELLSGSLNNGNYLKETIPPGHIVCLSTVKAGMPVRKFNQVSGFATEDIAAGAHVHSHNLAFQSFEREYTYGENAQESLLDENLFNFKVYLRKDGRAGTRNLF